jgi:tRNA threonylcarbamoyladenosine biosynthesis protein TsaE
MFTPLNYKLEDLPKIAKRVLEDAKSKTFLFYGKMGSGKTTLIKEICAQLDSEDIISSPTFSLVNEYHFPEGKIFHFDFYRIENEEEAWQIGFEEYLETPHFKMIEWPEKIPHLVPEQRTEICLKRLWPEERSISIENFD